jgi:hypothetical protein
MRSVLCLCLVIATRIASAADPVPLVKTMTDPSAPWDERWRAEDALAQAAPMEVFPLLAGSPALKMPAKGAIWNSGGRDFDQRAPVEWQIFYAVNRSWEVQTKKLTAEQRRTLWPDLLRRAETGTSKAAILNQLANHWVPAVEAEVTKLLTDAQQDMPVRRTAGLCLALHAARQSHDALVGLLETAPTFAERKTWFDVLSDPRHKRAAGEDPRVVRLGFALFEEERQRSPDSIDGAYFLALTLGNYVGAKKDFQPDTSPSSPKFFAATVRHAVSWWEQHRGESPKPNR